MWPPSSSKRAPKVVPALIFLSSHVGTTIGGGDTRYADADRAVTGQEDLISTWKAIDKSEFAKDSHCWNQHDVWYEKCCGVIYGDGGNDKCWDGHKATFENCCGDKPYHPQGCDDLIGLFDFQCVPLEMDQTAFEQCQNNLHTDPRYCTDLSPHLVKYLSCIQRKSEPSMKTEYPENIQLRDRVTHQRGAL